MANTDSTSNSYFNILSSHSPQSVIHMPANTRKGISCTSSRTHNLVHHWYCT
uniref:Uncharacterized protein n=1 Tax=Rhizophora mucronata TaxID=61149 RepID=A0A2P2JBE9_RHIMU